MGRRLWYLLESTLQERRLLSQACPLLALFLEDELQDIALVFLAISREDSSTLAVSVSMGKDTCKVLSPN
jgi:hypothetical protein